MVVAGNGDSGSPSPPHKRMKRDMDGDGTLPLSQKDTATTMNSSNTSNAARTVWQEQVVRLMVQSIRAMGYRRSADLLENESGCPLEAPRVVKFRAAVLAGQWNEVMATLPIVSSTTLKSIKFLILEQQYLELLERRQVTEALTCLREELTPLDIHHDRVHPLTSLVMCKDEEDLRITAGWDGAKGGSRAKLLKSLQEYFPANEMVAEGRLDTLLHQALAHQRQQCMYHNTQEVYPNLLVDHMCARDTLPTTTIHVLSAHTDEVWYTCFSHDGTRLASASKDTTCILWDLHTFSALTTLRGHTNAVSFVAWRHDDTMLLTCANDHRLKVWNTLSGASTVTINRHTDSVTVCAWCPDGLRFVSASLDQKTYLWELDGTLLRTWSGARISDMAITLDGLLMIAVCHEKMIRFYPMDGSPQSSEKETDSITSLSLSSNNRYIIINLASEEIHLWDIITRRLVKKYYGQHQGQYVIRSCFGGSDDRFIASGSEESGRVLEVLHGHTQTVNSVAWNAKDMHMLASASDDNTVRLWGPPPTSSVAPAVQNPLCVTPSPPSSD